MLAEATKSAHVAAGKSFLVVGDLMTILLTRADTDDQYILVEIVSPPGGGMPMLHVHPAQESFYIVEGNFEFYRQDADGNKVTIPAAAGSTLHAPGNAPHAFSNVGDTPGKIIMTLDAVGKMDDFFAEIGIPVEDPANPPVPDGPPDMEALLEVCARYNIHFLEAPPA